MKKLLIALSFTLALGACSKSECLNPTNQTNGSTLVNSSQLQRANVWYGSEACDLRGGGSGCQCVITTADESCATQTECTKQESLINYNEVLHTMFTDVEIQIRSNSNTPITEPELLQALQLDGFPAIYPVIVH